jgi:hypothetical protein
MISSGSTPKNSRRLVEMSVFLTEEGFKRIAGGEIPEVLKEVIGIPEPPLKLVGYMEIEEAEETA